MLYINRSGKYIEINFIMKIPYMHTNVCVLSFHLFVLVVIDFLLRKYYEFIYTYKHMCIIISSLFLVDRYFYYVRILN